MHGTIPSKTGRLRTLHRRWTMHAKAIFLTFVLIRVPFDSFLSHLSALVRVDMDLRMPSQTRIVAQTECTKGHEKNRWWCYSCI
jgi:hypothetical protein